MSRSITTFKNLGDGEPIPVDLNNPLPVTAGGGVGGDAGGRQRVSQLTTLFDGKHIALAEDFIWATDGDGTATFNDPRVNMAVAAGEYVVRQSKFYNPYFSGKSQLVELTVDGFAPQDGVTKRMGYFSSSPVAPYDADLDGFWLESANGIVSLKMQRQGAGILDLPMTKWDAYKTLRGYNWNGFTVVLFDFLWLGGAVLRMFIKTPAGFVLAHTFGWAGSGNANVFMKSPNQPVRYEIRSTTGAGQMNEICSQVSTEGSQSEVGHASAVFNATAIACNSIGTTYALLGVRKLAAYRNLSHRISAIGGLITEVQTDSGIFMLLLNPTLANPLSWADNDTYQVGTGSATTTVSNAGQLLACFGTVSAGDQQTLERNILANLPIDIDDGVGELVVAYRPYTANQNASAIISMVRQ